MDLWHRVLSPAPRVAARILARAGLLALLGVAAGCGKDSTPPHVATTIVVSVSSVSLDALGATESFAVSVRDQNGETMSGVTPTVTAGAPAIASVTGGASPTVTAVGNGSTLIAITAGHATSNVSVIVSQLPMTPIKVSGDAQSGTVGDALAGTLRVKLQDRLGHAVAGREVSFGAAAGSGSASPVTAATASDGTASTTWTLGTAPGAMTLNATSAGVTTAAAFTAVAAAGAPASLTSAVGNNQTARVGVAVPVAPAARVTDRFDNPIANVSVTFTAGIGSGTITGSPATTNAQGIATIGSWTLGTTPGVKSMAATATGLNFAAFNATATIGPATALIVNAGNNQVAGIGTTLPVAPSVKVVDLFSNGIAGVTVSFSVTGGGGSATATTATSDATGVAAVGSWTLGSVVGANTLTATAVGMTPLSLTATASLAPTIAGVSPFLLVPGSSMTISGTGFALTASGNTLKIGGVTATVTAATATQLTATVPCVASGTVGVVVTSGGLTSAIATAAAAGAVRTLAVGQAYVATNSASSVCNELPAAAGNARYLVSVYSASTSANSQIDFELGGNVATGAAASARQFAPLHAARLARTDAASESEDARRDRMHFAHLERERVLVEEMRAKTRQLGTAGARAKSVAAAVAAPTVGERRVFYWNWNACSDTLQRITARVIYAGSRAIIWEDTSNALQSNANTTLSDRYQRLGQIFDTDQYDVIRNTFGDPLRRDALTDNDARVHMLFTHRVNEIGGVAAYVTSLDQYPRATCGTSNFGEFFYGSVPTTTGTNLESTGNPEGWFNFINRTVVHEVKHIAAMAARVANNATFEPSWLEEGTARMAEEVWARQSLHHTAFQGNAGYGTAGSNGLLCDFNPANATCLANDPLRRPSFGARRQFNELLPKLQTPWDWSLFGDGLGQGGSVFYQTVWSLVRYAIDTYGASDAAFLTALTNATATGTTNLAGVTGVPFDQLVGGWSLALYADDYPGLTGASNVVKFQTWNMRNIYNSLNTDLSWAGRFNTPFPIVPTALSFGSFTAQQTGLRGGANAYYELSGSAATAQLLNLRALGGGNPSNLLRIAIVRLQ